MLHSFSFWCLIQNAIINLKDIKIYTLHSLKILDVSRNNLEMLPADICKLPLLEVLHIHRNCLVSSCLSLFMMNLFICGAQVSLPETMSTMKSLRVVDASYNNLTEIGSIFDAMPLLETLNLSNNPNLKETAMSERSVRLVSMVCIVIILSK